ncbi:hypothetical protein A2313_04735 [Candidatus Roizmanbacteria bacterium RIFOXYB2_FULL_41_10]|uniref:TNase-like domain-containing protein n=1 Tax=Candidatus Roizmanbacteria bacterium RIFOXYA1_FULL_41_12 TaxID=1802082 RepID=A0A1F7K9J2_9BACT|nr:MAG: hypothetical protein A2209_02395 [Candidatus Roizmanbacteria bacterium RIFOXYA1_FULL_41_12]OGK67295.1 MAG: hypothetical protein A2377_00075 [Candidatus Roizmanbacteria bacterium RIFOXYB1_FULL_41_27]OGK67753.1 MAG: hypothetical protein A2262_01735 [Candidatus Roizmanbacteria bacterium RIFOXYA2_FULL_41_8]OGK69153.1 MAG: hypothetical protein A2313_04735 [Candidatus Roizmanbacteria bacterium RIFOXYB2_FULL_41_10]OGK71828.1 MAG: hypothetical protein A2403_02755 [Candidatus Roizmanbacteria bac
MAKKKKCFSSWQQFLIGLAILIFSLFGYLQFRPQTHLVTRIIDGDTIELDNGERVRYLGVDTPEIGECYATAAISLNRQLVLNKQVHLQTDANKLDQYGRILAYVFVSKIMINQELLRQGAGAYFEDYLNHRYQAELIAAAQGAHQNKTGLWRTCAQDKKLGCLIKGNLDPNDRRFYHLPGFRHYSQIVMNLDKGDRWFCTEPDAIAAGFKRARE